jgi:hypothetical protein
VQAGAEELPATAPASSALEQLDSILRELQGIADEENADPPNCLAMLDRACLLAEQMDAAADVALRNSRLFNVGSLSVSIFFRGWKYAYCLATFDRIVTQVPPDKQIRLFNERIEAAVEMLEDARGSGNLADYMRGHLFWLADNVGRAMTEKTPRRLQLIADVAQAVSDDFQLTPEERARTLARVQDARAMFESQLRLSQANARSRKRRAPERDDVDMAG